MAEQINDLLPAAGVTTGRAAESLAERAGEDVNPAHDPAVFVRATAGLAHEADRVGIIDHDEGVVFVGEVADALQIGDEPIHREHPVGSDELEAGLGGVGFLQLQLEVFEVVVLVTVALRLAEPDPVDDRRMIQLVGDDGILRAEQGLEQAAIGVETGGVEDGVVGAEELGEGRLEVLVYLLRAADETHGGEAVAPAVKRRVRGGDEFGMVGEAQVIVGAEIQHFLA